MKLASIDTTAGPGSAPAGHGAGSAGATRRRLERLERQRSVRLAFVGQSTYFEQTALEKPAGRISPAFVDHRAGAEPQRMLAGLRDCEPDVVVAFRPELIPFEAFDEIDALTVGFLTEPLPRPAGAVHPDLERRLEYLRELDAGNFDRIVSFDPLIADSVRAHTPIWRSIPLPVSDSLFAEPQHVRGQPRALFTGRSTEHRETLLAGAKHHLDLIHVNHGVVGEGLMRLLRETAIGVNVHNEAYPTYEARVSVYLAAGHLVITEPLSPTHGLEPGIDYLEIGSAPELFATLRDAIHRLDAYWRVRVRGRMKAERFRASAVWPRLVEDLRRDLEVFGSSRRGG